MGEGTGVNKNFNNAKKHKTYYNKRVRTIVCIAVINKTRLPMKKNSTTTLPEMSTNNTIVREVPGQQSNQGPRKTTLDFLRQFARCYHYERALANETGSMILN